MVDPNNQEGKKYSIADNEDINIIGLIDFLLGGADLV